MDFCIISPKNPKVNYLATNYRLTGLWPLLYLTYIPYGRLFFRGVVEGANYFSKFYLWNSTSTSALPFLHLLATVRGNHFKASFGVRTRGAIKTCGGWHMKKRVVPIMVLALGIIIPNLAESFSVEFNPQTLSLLSKGKYVTCYFRSSPNCSLENIDVSSISITQIKRGAETFSTSIARAPLPAKVGDFDGDGVPELMVKFSRRIVTGSDKDPGDVGLVVEGLCNGASFAVSDTIRAIKQWVVQANIVLPSGVSPRDVWS